jgi:hypothetical protein
MTRITFGILALNSQPFLEYNLEAIYPFAHEIIVVEGAVRAAASLASGDGHSMDGTLEMLRSFQKERDPERKLRVVIAKDQGYSDGFWPEKTEMSAAYAKFATGDWLWQVDSDEFYLEEDMAVVVNLLKHDPTIDTISFPYIEFFGGFDSTITGVWHLYEYPLVHRVFRWADGHRYVSHRPPTVVDETGRDLRTKNWLSRPMNGDRPIRMYHYSYVLPKQANQKVGYYSNVDWTEAFRRNKEWFENSFLGLKNPLFLGEKGWPNLQWLERFAGQHPQAIYQLQEDLRTGKIKETLRGAEDIRQLLNRPGYRWLTILAGIALAVYWPMRSVWKKFRRKLLR